MKSFVLKIHLETVKLPLYDLNWKATFSSDCHDGQGHGKGDNHCWAAREAAGALHHTWEAGG